MVPPAANHQQASGAKANQCQGGRFRHGPARQHRIIEVKDMGGTAATVAGQNQFDITTAGGVPISFNRRQDAAIVPSYCLRLPRAAAPKVQFERLGAVPD